MGNGRSGRYHPEKLFPFRFSSLREGSWATWMDAQYAAHVAHAVDPWVLDASLERTDRHPGDRGHLQPERHHTFL